MVSFPPKRRTSRNLNLNPLIDIAFLLLVFFMLTGTLRTMDAFGVQVPEWSGGRLNDRRAVVVLVGADGTLAVNDEVIAAEGLADAVARLLDAADTERRVVLKADADAASGTLLDVMKRLHAAGIGRIGIATRVPQPQ